MCEHFFYYPWLLLIKLLRILTSDKFVTSTTWRSTSQRLNESGFLAVEKLPLQIVEALVLATVAASLGVAIAVGICNRTCTVPVTS